MYSSRAERSALRKYAGLLGPLLRRDYGASEYHTPEQMRAAITTCKLPRRYISFGYAAFMSEEAFRTLGAEGDYQSLRLRLLHHASSGFAPPFDPAPVNSYAASGYGPSHHDASDHGSL